MTLGCEFIVSHDNKNGSLGEPHVIKSLSYKIWIICTGHMAYKKTWHVWFHIYQAIGR